LARVAAGEALLNQFALQALHEAALTQAAWDAFWNAWNALHNPNGGSSLAKGLAGAKSGSTHGRAGGPGVGLGSSNGAHSRGSGSDRGGTGTGNGSSSNPATVNLVASQSSPARPAITALLLGLLVLALVVVAVVAMRRHTHRVRVLVASAGDDEGAA
jgi:cobalamin biosynthesis Mg chelatase CobN